MDKETKMSLIREVLPETMTPWMWRRIEYMAETYPDEANELLWEGSLKDHLLMVDRDCRAMMEQLSASMTKIEAQEQVYREIIMSPVPMPDPADS